VLEEHTASDADGAVSAAAAIGFPVALKVCGDRIAHKTERGLVRLALRDAGAVSEAAVELLAATTPQDGPVELLVAPMVRANRELIAGVHTDAQFGPCVMLGVGGVLAEAIADVSFRLVPLTPVDAEEMLDDLATGSLLEPFRGEPAVDRGAVTSVLLALSRVAEAEPQVRSIDVNPLMIVDGRPVAVDALVEVAE
jgi:acetyl-CoA synthetase (ADP-forming)